MMITFVQEEVEKEAETKTADSANESQAELPPPQDNSDGGWGGWSFSAISYISDFQKVAAVAAEEISRNAAEAAKTAAKSISEIQNTLEDAESHKDDQAETSAVEEQSKDENDIRRQAALEKLENASEDSFFGQHLKVIDNSVESFASGAWQALGNAIKGGSDFVHKLEESIQQSSSPAATGSVAPSILETGKAYTAKGMQVLEQLGKETLDLLISETDKHTKEAEGNIDESQFEEVSFDRCFYIYGGPDQLEELEAFSNHYAMLFNRRKVKLASEQRSIYDGKLKQVQQIFDLSSKINGSVESEKGKQVEAGNEDSADEIKNLHDSSVRRASELAVGFDNALAGLTPNDMVQRTAGRLDSLHSEGVQRLSDMCCSAVTQLLMLGKSIISNANKALDQDANEKMVKFNWPEDSVEKAMIIRAKTQLIVGLLEAICSAFITGISNVTESHIAATKGDSANLPAATQKSIQDKANAFSKNLHADQRTAMDKIQDGLQYLSYVVLSTSIPAA
ncbi:PREDICTED: uncharacterized protein LOC109161534 isoform X2 [Ipomoea nil]|uniref:uncharacterized protein LOC109161534 isoform X2 n=1 Tax=Ipomoea nil TaxID=35883 RepID=UPI000901ACF4|nr:PREDICTED: uncharacterized protein LOC109161534 isoform X2 [Ipomoea nil]